MASANPVNAADSSPTVLVVDDEALVRFVLADELHESGWTILEASNAEEALQVLRSSDPVDVLVTDIRMPGSMDGIGLTRVVRSEFPGTGIIVVSAEPPLVALIDSLDGYFQKPYDTAAVRNCLAALLGRTTSKEV